MKRGRDGDHPGKHEHFELYPPGFVESYVVLFYGMLIYSLLKVSMERVSMLAMLIRYAIYVLYVTVY